jgi:hypothetical protein
MVIIEYEVSVQLFPVLKMTVNSIKLSDIVLSLRTIKMRTIRINMFRLQSLETIFRYPYICAKHWFR